MIGKRWVLVPAALVLMHGTAAAGEADEAAFTPIASLEEVTIPKEKLPAGWTLLENRLIRDQHDTNLQVTVDAAAEAFGVTVVERACQPLTVGGQSFNVDFFLAADGAGVEKLFDLVKGWANPGTPGDIRWACARWQTVIMVICTSDSELQREVYYRYLGNLLDVLDAKAAALLEAGEADKALACYRFLGPGLKDLPRAYLVWGGLWLHQFKDYPKAVACYERAVREGGESAFTVEELWQIYEGLGLSAGLSKDPKKALAAFQKSLEFAEKSQDAKRLGESHYNLACAYAELGETDKMYPHLEEAFKHNTRWGSIALRDPSFARYVEEPEFKALIAKYSPQEPPKSE